MTKIIGLTGGIGSGKSTIAKYFEEKGIPVYIADKEAKKLLESKKVSSKLTEVFGVDIIENEIIDKSKLAALVFNNPEKLAILNGIIHPEVKIHFENWVKEHSIFPIVIKEAAILFESGSYKDCDKIILVTAPEELRIERVMKRDGVTREAVLSRMANQWSDAKKIALTDFIIENINAEVAKNSADDIIITLMNQ